MLQINEVVSLPEQEIEFSAIRATGSGGQKVNKTSSAIHLRFDIKASSLPPYYKSRLLNHADSRITADGVVVIKAQQYRTQEQNRDDAQQRLVQLIKAANVVQKSRRPTRPSRSSRNKRMDSKSRRGQLKQSRNKKMNFD